MYYNLCVTCPTYHVSSIFGGCKMVMSHPDFPRGSWNRTKISLAVLMFPQMDLFSYTEYFSGNTFNNFCCVPVKKVHHKILMLVTLWWFMLGRKMCVFFIRQSISVLSNCDICTCEAAEFEVLRNRGKFAHHSTCVLCPRMFKMLLLLLCVLPLFCHHV